MYTINYLNDDVGLGDCHICLIHDKGNYYILKGAAKRELQLQPERLGQGPDQVWVQPDRWVRGRAEDVGLQD